MIKIESTFFKLFLILSAIFAVVMVKYFFGSETAVTETVDIGSPIRKYYIPALRRRY